MIEFSEVFEVSISFDLSNFLFSSKFFICDCVGLIMVDLRRPISALGVFGRVTCFCSEIDFFIDCASILKLG